MTTETTTPKRPVFKLSGIATIKHLNVRKEGPDDEKILAVDVKLAFEKLDRAILGYFEPDGVLPAFLWRGDPAADALIVRNAFLSPLAYSHEIGGASVKIDGGWFPGSDVKKFSIQPRDGGLVDITCSVSIFPSSNEVAELAKNVQDGARVEIEGPPDLFDGDGGAVAAGNASAAAAAQQLDGMVREDGGTATVETSGGETLLNLGEGPDPMLDQAREIVLKERRASISLVQRHLRLGYNRAARLLEALEAEGTVSAMNASGSRTILKGA